MDKGIQTYKEFRSAFTTTEQRQGFLLSCARQGFAALCREFGADKLRLFVFGSAARKPAHVGANSDLDIAISGADGIAERVLQRRALLHDRFMMGLPAENQGLPVDVLTFDAQNPQTQFAMEILRDGIELTSSPT